MTARADGRSTRGVALVLAALAGAVLASGCGDAAGPRPTDPRKILADAVTATANLPTLRLHVEIASTVAVQPDQRMTMAIDLDVDLPTRQFAGRSTMQVPQMVAARAWSAQQVSDLIVTQAATFTRNSANGRWVKLPADIVGVGRAPTNAQIAAMIANLVGDPSLALALGDASPCTLGTCDRVLARVDGRALGAALGALIGMPIDAAMGGAIPNFDLDILVDQATSVISEIRTSITVQGSTTRLFVTLNNPGQPVQIVPPPPALVDDMGMGGFGGAQVTTILEEVGNEIEATPFPVPAAVESPLP